jgi:hypothetical protein
VPELPKHVAQEIVHVRMVFHGRGSVFAALDQWNSEVIGHHVSTGGSRVAI